MTTPRKERILRRGRAIAMERQVRAGLPAITPSEKELKESGAFREAQLAEMRVDQEALAEQRKYLQEMASEFRLMVIPLKGLRVLKRETGYEWTNGWTKHKKSTPTTKIPSPSTLKEIESLLPKKLTNKQLARRYKQLRATKKAWIADELSNKYYRGVIDPGGVTGKVPRDVFLFTNLDPTIREFKEEITRRKKPPKLNLSIPKPKPIIKPVKPRKKRHVERAGKTMRALRKIDGVKVFSFPDDVWKVRKPRKRRKK